MIKLITHNDILSTEFQTALSSELSKSKKFLYLTATLNLKTLRLKSEYLSSNWIIDEPSNIFTFTEYVNNISKQVYTEGSFLSISDQKYILFKVISYYFKDDILNKTSFNDARHQLYDLYSFLLFNNKKVHNEKISKICADYSIVESNIFWIFKMFSETIENIISAIQTGEIAEESENILGKNFINLSPNDKIDTFANKQKQHIHNELTQVDSVFFDGFLFFDDLQKHILETAIKLKKRIFILSKQFDNDMGAFLLDDNFKNLKVEKIKLTSKSKKILKL